MRKHEQLHKVCFKPVPVAPIGEQTPDLTNLSGPTQKNQVVPNQPVMPQGAGNEAANSEKQGSSPETVAAPSADTQAKQWQRAEQLTAAGVAVKVAAGAAKHAEVLAATAAHFAAELTATDDDEEASAPAVVEPVTPVQDNNPDANPPPPPVFSTPDQPHVSWADQVEAEEREQSSGAPQDPTGQHQESDSASESSSVVYTGTNQLTTDLTGSDVIL